MTTTKRRSGGYLLLEDGTRFDGEYFWGTAPCLGEAVFNTSHSGYQEILSDPSYRGQIMVFTAPHIGNVGVNSEDMESPRLQVVGAVLRSLSPRPSNWRSEQPLPEWMHEAGSAPLLVGADTRLLTLHLRQAGAMRAGLFPADFDERQALEQIRAVPSMAGADLATDAGCTEPYDFGPDDVRGSFRSGGAQGSGLRVGVLDLGVKRAILEELARRGCQVRVFPARTPMSTLLAGGFDGLLLSNGPGDPAATQEPRKTVTELLPHCLGTKLPLMGICLGHQLLCLAAGMETFKLRFGHRGANHPVRRVRDGRVEITSQNHGFAVRDDAVPPGFVVTHINLNDGTVEGLAHEEAPVFSIQYHPEASPGPLEGLTYFDDFVNAMRRGERSLGATTAGE